MSNNSIDTDIDNYSIDELYQILQIKHPTLEKIMTSTRNIINRFTKENNKNFVDFFQNVQNRLIEAFMKNKKNKNRNIDNREDNEDNDQDNDEDNDQDNVEDNDEDNGESENQQSSWDQYQYLVSSDAKTNNAQRRQGTEIFDNSHATMKQKELNIQNTFNLPFIQGTFNPILRNFTNVLLNIDSQYRKNIKNSTTNYTINLSENVNNILSLQLNSLEMKRSWYVFDESYGNTTFTIVPINEKGVAAKYSYCVCIPRGNYLIYPDETNSYNGKNLVFAINQAIKNAFIRAKQKNQLNSNQVDISPTTDDGQDILLTVNQLDHKASFINRSKRKYQIVFYDPERKYCDLCCDKNTCTDSNKDKDMCNYCTGSDNSKINSNLGWNLGFRSISDDLCGSVVVTIPPKQESDPAAEPEPEGENDSLVTGNSIVDVYGTRYILLVIDEYAKNRVSKNLIGAENEIKRLELPRYYNSEFTETFDNENNNNNEDNEDDDFESEPESDPTECGPDDTVCIIDEKCGQQPLNLLKKTKPRKFTQAQLYTINEIKIFNNKKLNQKYIAPITTDIFVKIPIKLSNSLTENNFEQMVEVVNDTNIFTTERLYNGPINIKRLNVKLVDDKGNIMNFYQADWSFSLIAKQLYQF